MCSLNALQQDIWKKKKNMVTVPSVCRWHFQPEQTKTMYKIYCCSLIKNRKSFILRAMSAPFQLLMSKTSCHFMVPGLNLTGQVSGSWIFQKKMEERGVRWVSGWVRLLSDLEPIRDTRLNLKAQVRVMSPTVYGCLMGAALKRWKLLKNNNFCKPLHGQVLVNFHSEKLGFYYNFNDKLDFLIID